MKAELERFEPREGGTYRMVLRYEGAEHTPGKSSEHSDVVEGRFVELVPNVRVVQEIDFESDDPAFAGTMRMIWSLVPVAAGTEVAIACENVPDGISQEDHAVGLTSSLENLAAFVE
ncbi:MAG: Aha1 domain family protein [Rhizobium sp.]|nr:Aha1 domain family protein [Rhizobium sp.]